MEMDPFQEAQEAQDDQGDQENQTMVQTVHAVQNIKCKSTLIINTVIPKRF